MGIQTTFGRDMEVNLCPVQLPVSILLASLALLMGSPDEANPLVDW